MLILTRRVGESVVLGSGEIRIILLGLNGVQVRMGFEAPANLAIYRLEVWERIQREGVNRRPADATVPVEVYSSDPNRSKR
jgi:carbon storage regulator